MVWRHWTLGMVAPTLSVYGLDVLVELFRCGGWCGLPHLGVTASCAAGALVLPASVGELGIPR